MSTAFSTPEIAAIGWHGKLPTVGDFVTRRLDTDFVNHWDNWMSRGLAELRQSGGSRWLDSYLRSPTWRFLSTPGFLPTPLNGEAWVGVVMPSVDRVGRYYPLTLASPLNGIPDRTDIQAALWNWMQRLEDVAIDALEGDWSIDALETGLVALGFPPGSTAQGADAFAASGGSLCPYEAATLGSMERFFAESALRPQALEKRGRCAWYCRTTDSESRIFLSTSLDDSIAKLWADDFNGAVVGD